MSGDRASLLDIIESMRAVVGNVDGKTLDQFLSDDLVVRGVERRLEIIGEAAKRLSPHFREMRPDIPWRRMAGMRDLLIHAYDHVEYDLVYSAVVEVIPSLIPRLVILIETLPES